MAEARSWPSVSADFWQTELCDKSWTNGRTSHKSKLSTRWRDQEQDQNQDQAPKPAENPGPAASSFPAVTHVGHATLRKICLWCHKSITSGIAATTAARILLLSSKQLVRGDWLPAATHLPSPPRKGIIPSCRRFSSFEFKTWLNWAIRKVRHLPADLTN